MPRVPQIRYDSRPDKEQKRTPVVHHNSMNKRGGNKRARAGETGNKAALTPFPLCFLLLWCHLRMSHVLLTVNGSVLVKIVWVVTAQPAMDTMVNSIDLTSACNPDAYHRMYKDPVQRHCPVQRTVVDAEKGRVNAKVQPIGVDNRMQVV